MSEFKTAGDKMDLSTRLWTKDDYPLFVDWWKAWDFPPVAIEMLPPCGVVVTHKDKPVAATWVYSMYQTPIAWMEWIISDKSAPKELRGEAVNRCIDTALFSAKMIGHSVVFTSVKNQVLQGRLEKHGFVSGDTGVTQMIKRI